MVRGKGVFLRQRRGPPPLPPLPKHRASSSHRRKYSNPINIDQLECQDWFLCDDCAQAADLDQIDIGGFQADRHHDGVMLSRKLLCIMADHFIELAGQQRWVGIISKWMSEYKPLFR